MFGIEIRGEMKTEIERFKIASNRLKEYDYTTPWWYFVTICVKNHKQVLSSIENNKMSLSSIGKIIEEEWLITMGLRSYIELDEYVIMPNHFHGIIIINSVEATGSVVLGSDIENKKLLRVEDGKTKKMTQRVISTTLQPNSLGSIIGQFKSACTKRIRAMENHNFAWQANYYDHIIRNQKDLDRIREYIQNNPLKWELDKYYN